MEQEITNAVFDMLVSAETMRVNCTDLNSYQYKEACQKVVACAGVIQTAIAKCAMRHVVASLSMPIVPSGETNE